MSTKTTIEEQRVLAGVSLRRLDEGISSQMDGAALKKIKNGISHIRSAYKGKKPWTEKDVDGLQVAIREVASGFNYFAKWGEFPRLKLVKLGNLGPAKPSKSMSTRTDLSQLDKVEDAYEKVVKALRSPAPWDKKRESVKNAIQNVQLHRAMDWLYGYYIWQD